MERIQRRQLLQAALGTVLPTAILPMLGPTGCAPAPADESRSGPTAAPLTTPLTRVGAQLYTVRNQIVADPVNTLSAIASAGYREVEFAGYHGRTPAQWKADLDRLGLTAPGAHLPLDVFQNAFSAALDNALVLGHQFLVMPLTPGEYRSPDGYRQIATILNNAGQLATAQGVQVVFHNHDFDFQILPDALPNEPSLGYDILAAELDPNLVNFELDTYWIEIAGYDTIDYLQRYPGRTRLMHLKDTSALQAMADVGYGTLDWLRIIAAAQTAGVQHFIVEHDSTADPFGSLQRSYDYLTGAA